VIDGKTYWSDAERSLQVERNVACLEWDPGNAARARVCPRAEI
jgi:hypothetical protein